MPALEDYYECLHHKKEVRLSVYPYAIMFVLKFFGSAC